LWRQDLRPSIASELQSDEAADESNGSNDLW